MSIHPPLLLPLPFLFDHHPMWVLNDDTLTSVVDCEAALSLDSFVPSSQPNLKSGVMDVNKSAFLNPAINSLFRMLTCPVIAFSSFPVLCNGS
jgi:hypothetical protein